MDPVKQAHAITKNAAEVASLEFAEAYPSGENQRFYDYIKVELPLMIEAYEGRDPAALPGLTDRQKNLLDMTPTDLKDKILKDEEAARRMMGWVTPHSPDEIRQFITRGQSPSMTMLDILVYREESRGPHLEERMAKITNSPDRPMDAEAFEQARRQTAESDYYKPGSKVKLSEEGANGNPFAGPTRTVEEIMLSAAEGSMYMVNYRLDNQEEWRNRGALHDARGTQHGYGVVTEAAGRLYYVEIEKAETRYEDHELRVREIVGVEKDMQRGIYNAMQAEGEDTSRAPVNMREVLGVGKGQEYPTVSGEFTYHPLKGHDDFHGPIVVEANSWQSSPSSDEAQRTKVAVEKHLQKYEYGEIVQEPARAKAMSHMNEVGGPTSEYTRSAMQAQMASQGRTF